MTADLPPDAEVWFSQQIADMPAWHRSGRFPGYLIKGSAFWFDAAGISSLCRPDRAVPVVDLDSLPAGCLDALKGARR